MPTHKLACPQGLLHVRMTDVHQRVTKEMLRAELCRSGGGDMLCAYERVVDGMYGVEAYVQFDSRWRAARARAALDGRALYEGCCFLSIAVIPPIYNAITTLDDDELAPPYFYDDTPYAEWAAALAVVERHDGEFTSAAASASFASMPDESPDVPAVYAIDVPPSAMVPRATTPAVGASTAMHEGDDDSTTSSRPVPAIKPVMPTRCLMELLGDDTIGETPAFATMACSLTLKLLGDTVPPTATVLECADAKEVIRPQLSDVGLKHFTALRSVFVSERGSPATADSIQVTKLFLPTEDVFSTMIRPRAVTAVQFVLYDVQPLPWPYQKHPWPPPPMSFLMWRYCSMPNSLAGPSSCLQRVHLQLCRTPNGAKFSGMLFMFPEAQVDEKSLGYFIHGHSENIQWEIAWRLRYECAFLVQTDRLPTCNLALVEHCYSFSELSCCREPWTSLQLQLFIPGSGIQPGTPLFLGIDNFRVQRITEGYIEIHLGLLLYTWSLAVMTYFTATLVQLSRDIICQLKTYFSQLHDLLIALIYLQSWPVSEVYFSGHKLLYHTQFGSTTLANQKKFITDDYFESIRVLSFQFGTIGNASHQFQWYIAWPNTLARAVVCTVHLARSIISLMTTKSLASNHGLHLLIGGVAVHYSAMFQLEIAWKLELEFVLNGGLNQYFPYCSICKRDLAESYGDERWCGCASVEHSLDIQGLGDCVSFLQPKPPWSCLVSTNSARFARRYELIRHHTDNEGNALFRVNESWDQWLVSSCDSKLHDVFTTSAHFLSKELQLSWDLGDCSSSAWCQRSHECVDARYNPGILTSQVPWDPGGAILTRLGGKPKFMEGGLSASLCLTTCLAYLMGCWMGLDRLTQPNWKQQQASSTITRDKGSGQRGSERTEGFGLDSLGGFACVACSVFFLLLCFLPSTSSKPWISWLYLDLLIESSD